jgi:hypothetical protein
MARFSDRLVSANRLIIAAAAIYAGCVTFAHADVYDDIMMAPEHHTAQTVSVAPVPAPPSMISRSDGEPSPPR